jgi:hypothetical protein
MYEFQRLLYCFALTIALGGVAEAQTGSPHGTTPFVDRHDEQVFAPNCKATRRWVSLAAGEGSAATRKINTWIEKQVTVGKKLKASDCPPAGDTESYEYENQATLTGSVGNLVGISIYVYFPGGSGRVARDCVVFRLDTGERFSLKQFLKPSGKKLLAQYFCAGSTKDTESGADPAYFCSTPEKSAAVADTLFCLVKDGIEASAPQNGNLRLIAQQKQFLWNDLKEYFQLPTSLKALNPGTNQSSSR